MIELWISLFFLSLVSLGLGLRYLIFRRQDALAAAARRRIEAVSPRTGGDLPAERRPVLRETTLSSIPLLDRLLRKLPQVEDLRRLISQADAPLNAGTFVLLSAVLALAGFVLGFGRFGLLAGLPLACVLGFAPLTWLRFMRRKRFKAFEEQFPEAVELMARALRAGHSISSAMEMIAQEMAEPIGGEFGRTAENYNFGKSLEHALLDLSGRIDLQDLKFFITAVIVQKETGGNLAEILDNIGQVIRERFRLMRHARTLSAEGRLSGTILSIMPPALLAVLFFISPNYISPLFNHPLGKSMLGAGLALQILGMLVIKRLVKLDL